MPGFASHRRASSSAGTPAIAAPESLSPAAGACGSVAANGRPKLAPFVRSRIGWSKGTTVAAALFVAGLALFLSAPWFIHLQADSFRLLYDGRWIAHVGIPHREVFTVAAQGRAFVDQQWLAELIDYEAWSVGGYGGLALLAAVVFGCGYGLAVALMRRLGASAPISISCALLGMFGALSLVFIRAQIFAIPLFVLLLWLCVGDSEGGDLDPAVALVLPLLALWANLHGSVLVGVAVVGAYFVLRVIVMVSKRRWRTATVYGLLLLATSLMMLATPYGLHVTGYYRAMIGNAAVKLADIEWDPPTFPQLSFFQFVIPLIVACGSVAAARSKGHWPRPVLVLAVLITALAATTAMRNNVWLGVAAALLVADTTQRWLPTAAPTPVFVRTILAGGIALAVVGAGRIVPQPGSAFEAHVSPNAIQATADYLSSHPCSRAIGDNLSASALLWQDRAAAGRVAFDGELEVYPQNALRRWVAFQAASSDRSLSAAGGYDVLVGSTEHPALVHQLATLRDRSVLGADSHGIAVVRTSVTPSPTCTAVARR